MSWFSSLKNLLKVENPNKVLDVVAQEYSHLNIRCRKDSLVLYELSEKSAKPEKYEIVLHRPFNESLTEAFSICRCENIEIAENKFLLYNQILPVLVSISKDLNNSTQLQKICNLLSEHPTWTLAHLVIRLGQTDLLTHPKLAPFINTEETHEGISPLQLAIQDQNIRMVQALLNENASLDHFDYENNSVFHHAAITNKQIVNLLCEKSKNTLNSRNITGRTPLHVACSADKRDCVHALLEAGADVNISVTERRSTIRTPGYVCPIQELSKNLHGEDYKYGGTPLHWACSREVVEALVNKNCDINSLNFDQRTALHVMVLRDRLDCLVALLCFKADCNIGDKDGNTPLHLAVKEKKEDCTKALIVFGADMSFLHGIPCDTDAGSRILYILHSVGAPRCPEDETSCNIGCKFDETYVGTPPPNPISSMPRDLLDNILSMNRVVDPSVKKGRLLCLDGGGIRGLILIVILMELEKHFERPLCECFDWIAGTSTGGILALAFTSNIPLFDCLCLYFKLKDIAFCGKRPYTTGTFEDILKEAFGEKKTMTDIKHPKLMITSTLVDRLPVDIHIFRNYPSPSDILNVPQPGPFDKLPSIGDLRLWEISRATGAAPAYFRAFGRFLDGGLISNNPTLDALTEIEQYNAALLTMGRESEILEVGVVVSLGTGVIPVEHVTKEVDVFRPESLWDTSKFVFGVSTMVRILTDQATQADGRVVDRARAWCSSTKVPFFRFSPKISADVELDEKKNSVLSNMLWETKAYMHSKISEIEELARIIKQLSS